MNVQFVHRSDKEVDRYEIEDRQVGLFLQPGQMEIGTIRKATSHYSFSVGDAFLTPFKDELWVCARDAAFTVVTIKEAALRAASDSATRLDLHCQKHMRDARVSALIICLVTESLAGFPSGKLFLDSTELALASLLIRIGSFIPRPIAALRNGLTPVRLRRIQEFIDENLDKDLSLRELSGIVGLGVSHFTEMLRITTGLTPHRFLMEKRIGRARELLKNPNRSVLDVALACGFKTPQHFARVFRDHFKMTPSQFRRHYDPAYSR